MTEDSNQIKVKRTQFIAQGITELATGHMTVRKW